MDKTTKELIFEIKRKEEENTRHAEKMKEYIKAKKENKILRDSLETKLRAYMQIEDDYENLKEKHKK